jgi:hypothetical protein
MRTGKNRGVLLRQPAFRFARGGASGSGPAVAVAGDPACRSRDAAQQSVDALNPRLDAKSSAETPLARHSRTRSDHFASVSFVMRDMRAKLAPNPAVRKNCHRSSGSAVF